LAAKGPKCHAEWSRKCLHLRLLRDCTTCIHTCLTHETKKLRARRSGTSYTGS